MPTLPVSHIYPVLEDNAIRRDDDVRCDLEDLALRDHPPGDRKDRSPESRRSVSTSSGVGIRAFTDSSTPGEGMAQTGELRWRAPPATAGRIDNQRVSDELPRHVRGDLLLAKQATSRNTTA